MKKTIVKLLIGIFLIGILFRIFCGIFVIQPIGAITKKGAVIVYWRSGMDLDFISSTGKILEKSETGASFLDRGVTLGEVLKSIKRRKIFKFSHSETPYLWSTKGKK